MAIAYFIPDQAKLLAASSAHGNHNQSSSAVSGGGGGGNGSNTNGSPAAQPHSQAAHNASNENAHNTTHHNHNNSNNNHFRANITIPLSAYCATAAHADVGCWDLLTQIFCHALRFCHDSERHPTVIQISLEISSSGSTGDTTVQVGAQAAPVQQPTQVPQQTPVEQQIPIPERRQQQQQQAHASAALPSLILHPSAVLQCAVTPSTQLHSARAASVEGSAPSAEALPTAALSGSSLEPGTHKPSAKRN